MSQELSPSNSWLTIFLNYLNIPGHGQVEISLAERVSFRCLRKPKLPL